MAVEDIQKKKLTEDELDEVAGGNSNGESGPGEIAKLDIDDNESKINDRHGSVRRPLEHTLFQNQTL